MPCLRSINAISGVLDNSAARVLYVRVAAELAMKNRPMQRSVVSNGSHRTFNAIPQNTSPDGFYD